MPGDAWHMWKTEKRGVIREWAEVPYVPRREYEHKDSRPYRYLAIRLRRQQGEMFEDGASLRHFAVVSDLAAGVFPSTKHGANAAWLRLQVITHNLLQLLKKAVLPEESADAHPKRLRFAVFTMMGRLVSHAGQTLLRIAAQALAAILTPGRAPLRSVFTLQTGRCLRQRHHAAIHGLRENTDT